MAKIENIIRCDNCRFSTWLIGLGRHILMCKQKVNFAGKWSQVRLGASCANFDTSDAFKRDPQAPRRIALTQGKFALVDAEDYYHLAKFNWQARPDSKTIYAARQCDGKHLKMHREIMAAPDHLCVDHIDHNGLNNTRSNLRLCTHAQNLRNVFSYKGSTSKYKGVSRHKKSGKWSARIKLNNKTYHIGYFTDEIAAAKAYDKKAIELHGEFACLNFPPPPVIPTERQFTQISKPRPSGRGKKLSSRAQPRDLFKTTA